jgi:hypothetical protein
MKKVVFSSYIPLTESLLNIFPLDFLAERGTAVEYWDLSPLFKDAIAGKEISRPFVRRFTDLNALAAALLAPEASETLLITAIPYEPRFFSLYRLFSRSRAKLGAVIVGVLPMPKQPGLALLRQNARHLLDPKKASHILLKRAQVALKRLGFVRDFDVVFAAGSAAQDQAGRARVVPINHGDYDDWLASRDEDKRLIDGRYAVYLDQFAPAHPDFKFLGIKKFIDPERYYALVNEFFASFERRHGLEVAIAAHPKSDYPTNPFVGRKIFRSSARALVRHCECAFATASTSIGLAVLDRKPLIFFTTDDITERYRPLRHDVIPFHFARVLGRPCVNLDHPDQDGVPINPVDERLYDDYKYRYLVSRQSEGRLSREAYLNFLSRK